MTKRMTRKQFLAELKRLCDWRWRLKKKWQGSPTFVIRATRKRFCFCPVTAVCWALAGKRYLPEYYVEAAERMGLPKRIADRAAAAADERPAGHNKPLRRKLLRAVKLKERRPGPVAW